MAARLCGQAGPGEILATPEVVHLARAVDGVRYVDRGTLHLKGIAEPVRVTKVLPVDGDPSTLLAPLVTERARQAPRARRRWSWKWIAAAAAVVTALAVVVPIVISGGGQGSIPGIDANSVGLIDLSSHRLTAQVAVGGRPVAVASGAGGIWVANAGDNTVDRVDPATHDVQRIQVGSGPAGVAVGDGAVWVTNSASRTVSEISPKTNTVVATIPVGNGPSGIAVGDGAVWVADSVDATLSKIDPQGARVTATIGVGSDPVAVAVAHDLWVANSGDGTISQVDPSTGRVLRTTFVGSGPSAVLATPEAVWVANTLDSTVTRIDPVTGSVAQTVPVGDGPSGLASTSAGLWVASRFNGSVSLIPPGSGNPTAIHVGNAPQSATAAGSSLWVAATGAGAGHGGGTLTIDNQYGLDSIDPGVAYSPDSWAILIDTTDGLVSFDKTDGTAGSTIVPDLAVSVPRPTDDGKTYTFQLRPGISYSTGQVVQPSDFVRAFERGLMIGQAPPYFRSVVGGAACTKKHCDLSRGMIANDADRTLTIHLVQADSDFMYQLALPFGAPVPPGTSTKAAPTTPIPGTGPYMIQSYRPVKGKETGSLVLVRNPHFREWSAAAQPQGYPDRIEWQLGVQYEDAVTAVEQGKADWLFGGPPPDRVDEVRTRFADQVHVFQEPATFGFFFNTKEPPFNDVRVRQAISYAIDRRKVAELYGQAAVTCQVLPPDLAGYRPFCPYTLDPNGEGTWTAPDMEKARRLLDAAHVRGASVTVWGTPQLLNKVKPTAYYVGLLNRLGFHARLKSIPDFAVFFSDVLQAKYHAQTFAYTWIQDYPAAADFLNLLFGCASIEAGPNNPNSSQFCDPGIDRMMQKALELQATDPYQAGLAWAKVDQAVTTQAPWAAALTPTGIDLVSRRVKNYQHNPQYGLLVDQLWVG